MAPDQMGDLKSFFLHNTAGFRLFYNERDSDVDIKVEFEDQKCRFPGHKLILSTMSDVFRTMLNSDMIEKSSRVITIRDSSPLAVKQFLKYIYTGIIEFHNWTDAMSVLKVAHKYSVVALVSLSESYLVSQIVFSNVCVLYELGRMYSLKDLKKRASNFILDAAFIVSCTEGFLSLKPRSLEIFLADPSFNGEGEGSILNCLKDWATAECVRRCIPLSHHNILALMEPFFKHIRWNALPSNYRTFVPASMVEKHIPGTLCSRQSFHFAPSLQYHIYYVKLVVELGGFYECLHRSVHTLNCVKFTVDNHIFLCGFRMVGLFQKSPNRFLDDPSHLALVKDGHTTIIQFNLNSLPWGKGTVSGKGTWREMIAYLPYPIRVDPFSTYMFNLYTKNMSNAKWPRTRLDTEVLDTHLGNVHFKVYATCYGLTQLFVLPAPPYKPFCMKE